MFRPLFTETGHYNGNGITMAGEVARLLRPLFNRGFSPRNVMTIITSGVNAEMSMAIVQLDIARRRERERVANEVELDADAIPDLDAE